jgi:hypothetical protein
MPLADQRGHPCRHQRLLLFRHAADIDRLDEPVDHDQAKGPAILQLLRRHRDAGQHIAASGVSPLNRIGGGENIGDADFPAAKSDRNGGRFGLKFGKAAAHRHIRQSDGQILRAGPRGQTRRIR